MSTRTFVFCDVCNKQATRLISNTSSINSRPSRRNTDDRAWFEGSVADSVKNDWYVTEIGENICPKCYENKYHELLELFHNSGRTIQKIVELVI